jgi:hypothetical protein
MCQERRRGRLPVESTIPFFDPIAGRKRFSHTQIRQGSGVGFAALIISEIVVPCLTSFPLPFTLFFSRTLVGGVHYKKTGERAATVAKMAYRNTVLSIFSKPPGTGVSFFGASPLQCKFTGTA